MTEKCCGSTWTWAPNRTKHWDCTEPQSEALLTINVTHFSLRDLTTEA